MYNPTHSYNNHEERVRFSPDKKTLEEVVYEEKNNKKPIGSKKEINNFC